MPQIFDTEDIRYSPASQLKPSIKIKVAISRQYLTNNKYKCSSQMDFLTLSYSTTIKLNSSNSGN